MNSPLVSTITPCFRMQKYLKLFLELLPQQTIFEHLQVILDHNDPTAEELEWVREFQLRYPNRLKHLIKEKVVPIGPSMNDCIRYADADYVAIWNVDDLRTPDSLERQYESLQKSNRGVAYGDFCIVDRFGKTNGSMVVCGDAPATEHSRSMLAGPFFMFRKALCEKAGYFDEQLKSGADFDFCIRLALHSKFEHVKTNLGYYLNEGLGASTRPNSLQAVERTVIELRYGIYDKLDYTFLPHASAYNIPFILQDQQWVHIDTFVPSWKGMLHERADLWLKTGLKAQYAFLSQTAFQKKIRILVKHTVSQRIYALLKNKFNR